jgi:beta-N-acetylhexosaminidase
MPAPDSWSHENQSGNDDEQDSTLRYPAIRNLSRTGTLEQDSLADPFTQPDTKRSTIASMKTPQDPNIHEDNSVDANAHGAVELAAVQEVPQATRPLPTLQDVSEVTKPLPAVQDAPEITKPLLTVHDIPDVTKPLPAHNVQEITKPLAIVQDAPEVTKPLPAMPGDVPDTPRPKHEWASVRTPSGSKPLKRGTALLLIAFLAVIVLHTFAQGPSFFLGSQGWASVINGPGATDNANILKNIDSHLQNPQSGTKTAKKAQLSPQQYINLIVSKMTLDQKLGQMMIVQFTGSTYSLSISTMISQYNVGAVLVFSANGNIVSKSQLTSLIKQMKDASTTLPLAVAIDQEGGTVDRLASLDGPRPAEATLGASNDPTRARQAGAQDAKDLTTYGFNLNLAPVVDVTNVYNSQLYDRTYGNTPGLVTKMAAAYLQGLQQSGKVVGTLKHFPGLGDVGTDPHLGIPYLNRSKADLERIDWAPYRALIRQGNVHAIMVTHEIVSALDKTEPSSLSPKIIQGILRNDLGFQGVVMTDSLTMDALTAYASESQAAVLSVEAGADLLMGAASPQDVASMIQGLKQAINAGTLTQQRIDESVRRLLMMKYAMGLLPIPQN